MYFSGMKELLIILISCFIFWTVIYYVFPRPFNRFFDNVEKWYDANKGAFALVIFALLLGSCVLTVVFKPEPAPPEPTKKNYGFTKEQIDHVEKTIKNNPDLLKY